MSSSGSSANPFIWNGGSGYYSGAESGLQKVGARYYDPAVGMWISQDTEIVAGSGADSQSLNRYAYCESGPLSGVDPGGCQVYDPNDPFRGTIFDPGRGGPYGNGGPSSGWPYGNAPGTPPSGFPGFPGPSFPIPGSPPYSLPGGGTGQNGYSPGGGGFTITGTWGLGNGGTITGGIDIPFPGRGDPSGGVIVSIPVNF